MPSFPTGFLWGSATAAHQVEGGNHNNDWWDWEHDPASPAGTPPTLDQLAPASEDPNTSPEVAPKYSSSPESPLA